MSDFGKDHGLIHEAVVTGRKVGAGQDFWAALAHSEEIFRKVVTCVAAMLTPIFRLVVGFDRDMTKEKWELFSDTEAKEGEFKPELVDFFRDEDGDHINGDDVVTRTQSEVCGGQRAAEAMLRDQDKIPEAWRKYVLVFPRTVWRFRYGDRIVAYLRWFDSKWYLSFDWLESKFNRIYRVVRLGKISSSNWSL